MASNYKIVFAGTCCCGKRRYRILDVIKKKIISASDLTKREAKETIAVIEKLEAE